MLGRQSQQVYERYLSNPLALRALAYAVPACFLPFAAAITLSMGLRALRVANHDAWPPRGGCLPALIGVVLSSLSLLCWTAVAAVLSRQMYLY